MPQADLPTPDQRAGPRRRQSRGHPPTFQEPLRHGGMRRRRRDLEDGGVPVEPNNPHNLTGGAAASLEFDE